MVLVSIPYFTILYITLINYSIANLQNILLNIPKMIFSALFFVAIGLLVTKKKNLRL